ncbi:MAG TPA: DNA repair protein RecO [Firmicutes bacterium]|nr:DNA repair protein RecO [Bacillota bacterium]
MRYGQAEKESMGRNMAVKRVNAFVLKVDPVRENSQLVNIFSFEYGRLKTLLKAGRQSAARRARSIEQLSEYEILIYFRETSELHLISQFSIIKDFQRIREMRYGLFHSIAIIEHILKLMPLNEPSEKIYNLLKKSLIAIEGGCDARVVYLLFRLYLLKHLGLLPQTEVCTSCSRKLSQDAYYVPYKGGLVCAECFNGEENGSIFMKSSMALVKLLRSLSSLSLNGGFEARIGDELLRDANRLLDFHISYHLDVQLKSTEFLRF